MKLPKHYKIITLDAKTVTIFYDQSFVSFSSLTDVKRLIKEHQKQLAKGSTYVQA
jgi:hypothetical protein